MSEPLSRRLGTIEAEWSQKHEVDLDTATPEQVVELFDSLSEVFDASEEMGKAYVKPTKRPLKSGRVIDVSGYWYDTETGKRVDPDEPGSEEKPKTEKEPPAETAEQKDKEPATEIPDFKGSSFSWGYEDEENIAKVKQAITAKTGLSWDEYRKAVEAKGKELLAKADLRVRVPPGVLSRILNDGRLKSQHETGKSEGLNNPELREEAEASLFYGGDKKATPPLERRAIYAYLQDRDIGDETMVHQYGSVVIRLKSETKARGTWTGNDSLRSGLKPSPILDPKIESLHPMFLRNKVEGGESPHEADTLFNYRTGFYVEAQIHGGLSVQDFEEVIFTGTPPNATQKRLLEKAGIKWRVNKK